MKKQLLLILLAFAAMQVNAQKIALFDKLSNDKNVSSIYVSKALLSMMPNLDMGGADLKSISNKLSQIEIYKTENRGAVSYIKSEMNALGKNKAYERIMQVKDNGKNVVFWAEQQGNHIKDLIMFEDNVRDYTVVRLIGNFTTEDIQKVLNKN